MAWSPRKQVVVILVVIVLILGGGVVPSLWGTNVALNKALDDCRETNYIEIKRLNDEKTQILIDDARKDALNAIDWMNSAKRLEHMKDSVDIINQKVEKLLNKKRR